jgi:hypothetical protein
MFGAFLDWLIAHPEVWGPLAATGLASIICMVTPTPNPKTVRGKLYKVLEILAANVWKAKQTGEPKGLS